MQNFVHATGQSPKRLLAVCLSCGGSAHLEFVALLDLLVPAQEDSPPTVIQKAFRCGLGQTPSIVEFTRRPS
jgi:hypothetical protein